MPLGYVETAKRIRNRLRSYSAVSVVRLALDITHASRDKALLDQLQQLPWITFLLVKLVLEDKMTALYKGGECPREVFDHCRQDLWLAEKVPAVNDERGSVYLMLRSLIQAQLSFQKMPTFDFLRWPALISRLDQDHPTRKQFVARMGMEPDVYICVCYALYACVVDGRRLIKRDYFSPLQLSFGDAFDRFLSEFARDLNELRSELRRQLSARIVANIEVRSKHEPYEFPWLSNYPLLREGDDFIIWHPLMFARGMELAVHKKLSENGSDYTGSFSKVFEGFVLELLDDAGLKYLSENKYKEVVGKDKKAVEAIITNNGANVFIESKMTKYSEGLTLSDLRPVVWTGLKRVREAMSQGWEVATRLSGDGLLNWECIASQEIFLIIVTSQQVSCATGVHLQRMFRSGTFDKSQVRNTGPTAEQLELLPLTNIVIVSIEEFEHLMGCVRNREIDLVLFLREVAAAHSDPKTSVMFIDQMLGKKTKHWQLPKLLEDASQRAMNMMEDAWNNRNDRGQPPVLYN